MKMKRFIFIFKSGFGLQLTTGNFREKRGKIGSSFSKKQGIVENTVKTRETRFVVIIRIQKDLSNDAPEQSIEALTLRTRSKLRGIKPL